MKVNKIFNRLRALTCAGTKKISDFISACVNMVRKWRIAVNSFYDRTIDAAKKQICLWVLGALKHLTFVLFNFKRLGVIISNCAATIAGLIVVYVLYLPLAQETLSKTTGLEAIFLAIGGLIGTVLALVISLSVIPIQSASENFSSSIVHLYKEDRVTRNIFALLAVFCLTSFLMSIGEVFGYQKLSLLPVEVLFVAISLDLLRWHHRHIINLLGSNESIGQLSEKVKLYLHSTQKRIVFLAKIKWLFSTKSEKAKLSRENLEQALSWQFYSASPLKIWFNEFAEIAHKAVTKQEVVRAQLAISSLADIACCYLTERKDNLLIYPDMESLGLVEGSDVTDILTPIYEHFRNICNSAVDKKVETTSIHIVQAFGRIAICATNLQARGFQRNTAPLTYLPLGYLNSCIEMAQRAEMDDIALQGSGMLLNIVKSSPDNMNIAQVHVPVLKDLTKIAGSFLAKRNYALSNRCVTDMMIVGHSAVAKKHFDIDGVVSEITDDLLQLLNVAVIQQRLTQTTFLDLPLTPAYDLSQQFSLGYLVARATQMIEKPQGKDWVNPYHNFIGFNEPIRRHLYKIGEQIDFGSSFLLWHIIHTIKHIAKIFLDLLAKPVTDNSEYLKEVESCFLWYLSFFWLAFSKKKTSIELQFAEEATDALAFIGLLFYKLDRKEVTRICIDNIASIAESYQEMADPNSLPQACHAFNLVDVIMPIWKIRLLMEAKDDSAFLKQIDEKLSAFLKGKVMSVAGADPLDTRKRQLQEELQEDLHFSHSDKAIGVLKGLLEESAPSNPRPPVF